MKIQTTKRKASDKFSLLLRSIFISTENTAAPQWRDSFQGILQLVGGVKGLKGVNEEGFKRRKSR
jgi:hypothetical protein